VSAKPTWYNEGQIPADNFAAEFIRHLAAIFPASISRDTRDWQWSSFQLEPGIVGRVQFDAIFNPRDLGDFVVTAAFEEVVFTDFSGAVTWFAVDRCWC